MFTTYGVGSAFPNFTLKKRRTIQVLAKFVSTVFLIHSFTIFHHIPKDVPYSFLQYKPLLFRTSL